MMTLIIYWVLFQGLHKLNPDTAIYTQNANVVTLTQPYPTFPCATYSQLLQEFRPVIATWTVYLFISLIILECFSWIASVPDKSMFPKHLLSRAENVRSHITNTLGGNYIEYMQRFIIHG